MLAHTPGSERACDVVAGLVVWRVQQLRSEVEPYCSFAVLTALGELLKY